MNESLIQNTIFYGSRLHFDSSPEMTALCLLYDTVILPYKGKRSDILRISKIGDKYALVPEDEDDWNEAWRDGNVADFFAKETEDLIEGGAIKRVSAPDRSVLIADAELLFSRLDTQLIELLLQNPVTTTKVVRYNKATGESQKIAHESYKTVPSDLVRNFVRKDHNFPIAFSSSHSSDIAKLQLAASAFRLTAPGVGSLRPKELLELREKTKDNREGFSSYLQELAGGVAAMVRSEATKGQIQEEANSIVNTKIVPQLAEFERQLLSIKANQKSGFLQVISGFLQIDSAPWSPKFFGQILESIGALTQESVEQIVERNTNKNLSLNFLRKLRED